MADVDSTLAQWSTTASSNKPTGGTTIGSGLDDNVREIQQVVRSYLSHYNGSAIASAGTTDLGSNTGLIQEISGTTTITSLGTVSAGIWKIVRFQGALTLTHNATSLILPGGANITTAAGDIMLAYSRGSGNWTVPFYQKATGKPVIQTLTLTDLDINGGTAETALATGDAVAIYDTSAAANRKMTVANFLLIINALTEDTAPAAAADYLITYDTSAAAAKKVLPSNLLTAANGASVVLLGEQTASASTTLDFVSLITSTYDDYIFVLDSILAVTDSVNLLLRGSDDNGSTFYSTTEYSWCEILNTATGGAVTGANAAGTSSIRIGGTAGNLANEHINGEVWFHRGATTRMWVEYKVSMTNATPDFTFATGGGVLAISAVNAARFLMSSGNI